MKTPLRSSKLRFRSRATLVALALIGQLLVIGGGWFVTFRIVQRSFAKVIEKQVIEQNRELAKTIAALFPDAVEGVGEGSRVEYKSKEWERLQRIIETDALRMLPAGGFACLIQSDDGQLLCHPDIRKNPELRNFSFKNVKLSESIDGAEAAPMPGIVERVGDVESGVAEFQFGDFHYVATTPLAGTNLQLLIQQPVGAIARLSRQNTRFVLGIAGGMSVVILGITGGGLTVLLRRYDSVHEQLNRQMHENLRTAQRIQESSLPAAWPEVTGYSIAAWSRAADETGGDTFDVVGLRETDDGVEVFEHGTASSMGLVLADATGHGIGPALAVTQLQAAARVAWRSRRGVMGVARLLAERLHETLPDGRFITAWIGRLDADRGCVDMISAGQAPFLIARRDGSVVRFKADTLPLGISGELGVHEPRQAALDPGDTLVIISDGITEAANESGELYGVERLERLVAEHRDKDAPSLADLIRSEIDDFGVSERADDQTVLIVQRLPA